jgi:hypothetical protein
VAISWEKFNLSPSTGGFCILPKVLSLYMCCSPLWSILLVRKPDRRSTSLIPWGVSHTFVLLPKPERHSFIPDRVTRVSAGRWSASLLPLKGRPVIQTFVLNSLMVGLPIGSWAFSGFLCATMTCSLACWERQTPPSD